LRHGGLLVFFRAGGRQWSVPPRFFGMKIFLMHIIMGSINQNKSQLRLSCHKGPYFTSKHQKMFGISIKFTKKTVRGWGPLGKLRTHPSPLVGSSLSVPLPRGVQRHPRQHKMRHRNLQGRQNNEVWGLRLNVVS